METVGLLYVQYESVVPLPEIGVEPPHPSKAVAVQFTVAPYDSVSAPVQVIAPTDAYVPVGVLAQQLAVLHPLQLTLIEPLGPTGVHSSVA